MLSSKNACAKCPPSITGCTSASRRARPASRALMNSNAPAVRITALVAADVDALGALAASIWRAHYQGIISAAQIEYMLAERYAPAVVREELKRGDLWWDKLLVNGSMAGFASYFLMRDESEMKLDKLYVDPGDQRRGHGG